MPSANDGFGVGNRSGVSIDAVRPLTDLFDPFRLRVAREYRGLRKVELARHLDITPSALTQIENGTTKPKATTFAQLALALGFPVDFFVQDVRRRQAQDHGRSFFRSLRSTRQIDRDQAEALTFFASELLATIERYVELPEPDIPADLYVLEDAEPGLIERTAEELRRRWGVPVGAIANVVRLLEAHGMNLPIDFEKHSISVTTAQADAKGQFVSSKSFGATATICLPKITSTDLSFVATAFEHYKSLESSGLQRDVSFALRWLDRALRERDPYDRFASAWIGLETATYGTGYKLDNAVAALTPVYADRSETQIRELLKPLYASRNNIFHQASLDEDDMSEKVSKTISILIDNFKVSFGNYVDCPCGERKLLLRLKIVLAIGFNPHGFGITLRFESPFKSRTSPRIYGAKVPQAHMFPSDVSETPFFDTATGGWYVPKLTLEPGAEAYGDMALMTFADLAAT